MRIYKEINYFSDKNILYLKNIRMSVSLRKIINVGNTDKLRDVLMKKNSFTGKEIENEINELKRKKNSAILDMNNTISDETFNEMIGMLSNYQKAKLLDAKMQTDTRRHMESYLVGGRQKTRKLNKKVKRNKKKKTKRIKRKSHIQKRKKTKKRSLM